MEKISKLKLNKSTIRNLSEDEIKQIAGAGRTIGFDCRCIHTSAGPSHPIFC